ncbi:MAG: hypothetical protein LBL07_01945 [Tannerella sp.]|jgi:hypothetical protein|nr:hypothetical protein [Tannerella sp.]
MMAALRYFVFFLLVSFIPVENNRSLEGMGSLSEEIITVTVDGEEILVCLSDRINELIACLYGKEEPRIEAKKSRLSEISRELPAPFFLDLIVRTSDWFSGCLKIHINHFSHLHIQKDLLPFKTLSAQPEIFDMFIPPLKYYVYTLEKIIT